MAYDQPIQRDYFQPSTAFGATTESARYFGPKGKVGWVRDIDVYITADMVGTTSVPEICVGATAGSAEYGRFRLGTTLILGYTSAAGPRNASQVAGDPQYGNSVLEDFVGHVKMSTAKIPADTGFYISRVLGVGGSPAGTGSSIVHIEWV